MIVANDQCSRDKDEIAYDILSYLARHPHAQDTLGGITEWWLLEQKIKRQLTFVQDALEDLVNNGLILERKIENAETVYGINEERVESIKELLKKHKVQ